MRPVRLHCLLFIFLFMSLRSFLDLFINNFISAEYFKNIYEERILKTIGNSDTVLYRSQVIISQNSVLYRSNVLTRKEAQLTFKLFVVR